MFVTIQKEEVMPQMDSFNNKDWYSRKDRKSLPEVKPPPKYVENTSRRSDRTLADQRKMRPDGWPAGPSRDRRHGTANTHGEWQPGEAERSYPKSDPANAAWFKDHVYQKNDSRWVTKAGPPTPVGNPSKNDKSLMKSGADLLESRRAAKKAGGAFNQHKKKKTASPVNSMKSVGKP